MPCKNYVKRKKVSSFSYDSPFKPFTCPANENLWTFSIGFPFFFNTVRRALENQLEIQIYPRKMLYIINFIRKGESKIAFNNFCVLLRPFGKDSRIQKLQNKAFLQPNLPFTSNSNFKIFLNHFNRIINLKIRNNRN